MGNMLEAKQGLLEYLAGLHKKYELSKVIDEAFYEPGMMENLEQYRGEYNEDTNIAWLRVDAKGLRYENRTQHLETLASGEIVDIVRDAENLFNSNNFAIMKDKVSLGNLPADLCNVLAPLYDAGYASVVDATVSYVERLCERSRYAKQGVMFVELHIRFIGV